MSTTSITSTFDSGRQMAIELIVTWHGKETCFSVLYFVADWAIRKINQCDLAIECTQVLDYSAYQEP
jgi:hypothetical protein